MSDARARTLISAKDLQNAIAGGEAPLILHVFDDAVPSQQDLRVIPGAQVVSLAADFSASPTPGSGKRPLPELELLQEKVRAWGLSRKTAVVVYDDNGGAQAARAWWTLRWAGVDAVRILDGGLEAWRAAGGAATNRATSEPQQGDIVLTAGHLAILDADGAAQLGDRSILLDARGRLAYIGSPDDPTTGHIPGARSAPSSEILMSDKRFKAEQKLRAEFSALGVDGSRPLGVYCGSGNAGAHLVAALESVGLKAALYVGSWSAWSADPRRPVARDPS